MTSSDVLLIPEIFLLVLRNLNSKTSKNLGCVSKGFNDLFWRARKSIKINFGGADFESFMRFLQRILLKNRPICLTFKDSSEENLKQLLCLLDAEPLKISIELKLCSLPKSYELQLKNINCLSISCNNLESLNFSGKGLKINSCENLNSVTIGSVVRLEVKGCNVLNTIKVSSVNIGVIKSCPELKSMDCTGYSLFLGNMLLDFTKNQGFTGNVKVLDVRCCTWDGSPIGINRQVLYK
jgi:hypothetical protein